MRSPLDRLASCFLDKFVGGDPLALAFGTKRRIDPGEITFRTSVSALAKGRALNSNIHWRPQVEFLVYEDYDDWFPLERFSEAVARLADRIGLEVHDARSLTNHGVHRHERVGAPGEFSGVSAAGIAEMKGRGEVLSAVSLFTPELVEQATTLYAEDIALYTAHFGVPPAF